jgi:hypothetical protein
MVVMHSLKLKTSDVPSRARLGSKQFRRRVKADHHRLLLNQPRHQLQPPRQPPLNHRLCKRHRKSLQDKLLRKRRLDSHLSHRLVQIPALLRVFLLPRVVLVLR